MVAELLVQCRAEQEDNRVEDHSVSHWENVARPDAQAGFWHIDLKNVSRLKPPGYQLAERMCDAFGKRGSEIGVADDIPEKVVSTIRVG